MTAFRCGFCQSALYLYWLLYYRHWRISVFISASYSVCLQALILSVYCLNFAGFARATLCHHFLWLSGDFGLFHAWGQSCLMTGIYSRCFLVIGRNVVRSYFDHQLSDCSLSVLAQDKLSLSLFCSLGDFLFAKSNLFDVDMTADKLSAKHD